MLASDKPLLGLSILIGDARPPKHLIQDLMSQDTNPARPFRDTTSISNTPEQHKLRPDLDRLHQDVVDEIVHAHPQDTVQIEVILECIREQIRPKGTRPLPLKEQRRRFGWSMGCTQPIPHLQRKSMIVLLLVVVAARRQRQTGSVLRDELHRVPNSKPESKMVRGCVVVVCEKHVCD